MFVCERCGERSTLGGPCPRDCAPLTATDDALLGSVVGRYRLARFLGRGGMGRVYAAVQPELGSRVAIKVLSDDAADRADLVERFFAEARTASLIRHEGIVSVLDLVRTPDGRPAIVMELIDGKTLRELTRGGTAPLGGLVHVMLEVLSAVAAAHGCGIIHRDLKPDNILVTPSGRAKVLDFGIAKLATPAPGGTPRTRTGALLGTPHYMSPEQIDGGAIDARSDVYSAGVVLFEAVTGHRPFEGVTDFELMCAHLQEPPPSPRLRRPELPQAIEDVILCALAKQRDERFQSANAMAAALHAASAALAPRDWQALVPGARMFPPVVPPTSHASLPTARSAGEPTPRRDGSAQARSGAARLQRRDSPTAHTPTVHDPVAPSAADPAPPDAPPEARATSPREPAPHRRGSRIAVPVAAAIVGGAIAAAVMIPRSSSPPQREARSSSPEAGSATAPAPNAAMAIEPTAAAQAGAAPPTDAHGSASSPGTVAASAGPSAGDNPGVAAGGADRRTALPSPGGPARLKQPGALPSVAIGSSATSAPADYDPKRFDPSGYLPRAERLARTLIADAGPIGLDFTPVSADGRVDLTADTGASEVYRFRTRRPPGHADADGFRTCFVIVTVTATRVEATRHRAPECGVALPAAPRCTVAQYMAKASAEASSQIGSSHVSWASTQYDGRWESDHVLASGTTVGYSSTDDCGGSRAAPRLRDPVDQPAQATQDEPTRKTILKHGYDPATFDPVGFIATAQQMARQLVEDAELTGLDVWNVASDGRIVWRFTPVHAEYRFRSPSRSLIEPTLDNQGQHPCHVIIGLEEMGAVRQLIARRDDEGHCDEPLEPLPRCSLAKLWARALAAGIKDDRIAEVTWSRAKWQFRVATMFSADRTVALNAVEQTLTFDDTCR